MILTDLLSASTREQLRDKLVEVLRMGDLPTPAWSRFSVLRHFVEREPTLLSDLWDAIVAVAKGGYLSSAKGPWLDLLGQDWFGESRLPAANTEGLVVLSDSASVGPTAVSVGSVWVGTPGYQSAKRFVVSGLPNGSSVPLDGSLVVAVRAEFAGSAWNVGNGQVSEMLTSIPGITVSNPAGPDGTWITSQGVDAEMDEEYAARLAQKWSLVGAGSTVGAYVVTARSASTQVRHVRVWSPYGGAVRLVVAGPSGPISAQALADVQAAVEAKRPVGVPDVTVANGRIRTDVIVGTLYRAKDGNAVDGVNYAQAAALAYGQIVGVGGRVSREKLIARMLASDDFEDAEFTAPSGDFVLDDDEIYVPTFLLSVA